MPQESYEYCTGRVSVLETRLLTAEKIERLVNAENEEAALRILSETEYAESIAKTGSVDGAIKEEKKKLYTLVEEITPAKQVTDLFMIKNDIHNLRVALKSRFAGINEDVLKFMNGYACIKPEEAVEMVKREEYSQLPEYLKDAVTNAVREFEENAEAMMIDVNIDKAVMSHAFDVLKNADEPVLKKYLIMKADLENIRSMLRIRNAHLAGGMLSKVFVEGGAVPLRDLIKMLHMSNDELYESLGGSEYAGIVQSGARQFFYDGTLVEYEKLEDDALMRLIKENRYSAVDSAVPLVCYILSKEAEMKSLRIIMVGKSNGLDADRIRERLRKI